MDFHGYIPRVPDSLQRKSGIQGTTDIKLNKMKKMKFSLLQRITDSFLKFLVHFLSPSAEKILQIELLSAGYADAGGSDSIIKVNGIDYSKKQRGFNVAILSGQNGDVISTERFDTCSTYKEANRMISYLSSTQDGCIILISVHHEAALSMTSEAERMIHALGSTTRLTTMGDRNDTRYGGSFALVAKKGGNKPAWLAEKAEDREKGPSRIQVQIPIGWYS